MNFWKNFQLHDMPNWIKIDQFMGREYCGKWLAFKEKVSHGDEKYRRRGEEE